MDFNKDIILENEAVLLRPLVENDFNELIHFSINEPDLWNYSLVSGAGVENFKKYINLALADKKSKKSFPFIVFDKRTNQFAGSTRFYDIQLQNRTLQLGYTWFGKKFQGTGINKNSKFLLLEFAFEKLGIERVEFRADNNNLRSIAAMKSLGCKKEGVLRSNCTSPTGRRDSIILSILKKEWHHTVKPKLLNKIKQK